MRKAWLGIGTMVLISTSCSHAPIETGAAPSAATVRDRSSATETQTALYVIDGVLVPQPVAPVTQPAQPLYVIDGVPIESPAP